MSYVSVFNPLLAICNQVAEAFTAPRLGELSAKADTVAVHCRRCGHTARSDLRRLMFQHGKDTRLGRLHFVCGDCGSRDVRVGVD